MPRGEPWEGPGALQGTREAQCVVVPERPPTRFPVGSTWRGRLTAALCISEQILFLHGFLTQLGKCALGWRPSSCSCVPSAPWKRACSPRRGDLFPREAFPAPVDRFVVHPRQGLLSGAGLGRRQGRAGRRCGEHQLRAAGGLLGRLKHCLQAQLQSQNPCGAAPYLPGAAGRGLFYQMLALPSGRRRCDILHMARSMVSHLRACITLTTWLQVGAVSNL